MKNYQRILMAERFERECSTDGFRGMGYPQPFPLAHENLITVGNRTLDLVFPGGMAQTPPTQEPSPTYSLAPSFLEKDHQARGLWVSECRLKSEIRWTLTKNYQ
uniref:Uncharacterized protein n=1 Tax=Photinus pyralis TaxID=7054 RepID=A0A1Y1MM33_PHOPY